MSNISEQELLELQKQTVQDTLSIAKVYIDQKDASVKSDLEEQLTTLSDSVTAKFEALDGIDESTLETLTNIKTTLEANGDLTQLLNGYASVDAQLEDILSRLSTAESKISAVETLSANNKLANESNTSEINTLKTRVTSTEQSIATLNGADDVEGSVAKAVKDAVGVEESRAKAVSGNLDNLTTDNKTNLVQAINEVDAHADEAKSVADSAKTTADSALAKAVANESAISILNGDDTVEGSVAKQIKDATGGDISDLAGRVEAEELESTRVKGILDDKVDGDGNVIDKGLVAKVSDIETELPLAEARAKAYADDKFLSGEMIQNIKVNKRCEIKNVANAVFGFALENCDGGQGGDGI